MLRSRDFLFCRGEPDENRWRNTIYPVARAMVSDTAYLSRGSRLFKPGSLPRASRVPRPASRVPRPASRVPRPASRVPRPRTSARTRSPTHKRTHPLAHGRVRPTRVPRPRTSAPDARRIGMRVSRTCARIASRSTLRGTRGQAISVPKKTAKDMQYRCQCKLSGDTTR